MLKRTYPARRVEKWNKLKRVALNDFLDPPKNPGRERRLAQQIMFEDGGESLTEQYIVATAKYFANELLTAQMLEDKELDDKHPLVIKVNNWLNEDTKEVEPEELEKLMTQKELVKLVKLVTQKENWGCP